MNNAATKITPKLHIKKVISANIMGTQLARDTAKIVRGDIEASRQAHKFQRELAPETSWLMLAIIILMMMLAFTIGVYYDAYEQAIERMNK